jgi:hypothetical protein
MCHCNKPFDQQAWRNQCTEMAKAAQKSCGLSHDLFIKNFSEAVDKAVLSIPSESQGLAIEIAGEWDYATTEQRQEQLEWNSAHGFCSHGIELGCCPAGCE